MTGFSSFGVSPLAAKTPSISQVRKDLKEGDLYQARKKTQKILEKNHENPEAQKLMADIIDQEIARHKEFFETHLPEELPKSTQEEEIKTWLERAKVLLDLKRYDEAVLATEKIFEYDAQNQAASRLMDEIRENAMKDGKQELLVRHEMYASEAKERVGMYLQQAEKFLHEKRRGAARLAVEKILLLEPSNKKALKMQRQIESYQKTSAAESLGAKTGASSTRERAEMKEFQ